ncbi:MAG: GntR family transcriptional regulator [Burkholderiaceae bacterium]
MPQTHPLTSKPHGTTVDVVFERLKKSIENGALAPGQRLIEADLTKDYGVSRGPLREAFRRLSAEGIIEFVPNRGAVVKKFSRKEISNIFRIRQVIEGLAAKLATESLALPAHQAERQYFERVCKDETSTDVIFAQENSVFHNTIVDLCDNAQLQTLIQQMRLPFLKFQIRSSLDQDYIDRSRNEHKLIAAAMLANNPKLAERLMQKHLGNAEQRLMTLPDLLL